VRFRPEAASRLVIGGLPASKLPLLLGLLGLTGLLALAALQQLRREHLLARIRADFVSSVSHELRTPLAQIRLFSETLLLNRVRSEAEGRRSLEIIQQESRRLAHLVDNVLFFSRAERGIERIAAASTPLAPLTTEVVETFLPLARASRATVRVDVVDAPDGMIDPAAFKQILLNLLDNAVKYGPAGQTIVVSVERRGPEAIVTVADQGPGVPADARMRIWEPYSRLVTASTSAIAGTGIGLAVVRRLVDLHGGSVRVEDAPGGGACFIVAFPAAGAAEPGKVGAPRSATA
jgi:signal transduction histidine kinase